MLVTHITHTRLHTHKHASLIEKPFPLASVKEHIFISTCPPTSYLLPQHYPRQRLSSAAPPSRLSLVATCLIISGKVLFLLMYKMKASGKQGSEKWSLPKVYSFHPKKVAWATLGPPIMFLCCLPINFSQCAGVADLDSILWFPLPLIPSRALINALYLLFGFPSVAGLLGENLMHRFKQPLYKVETKQK